MVRFDGPWSGQGVLGPDSRQFTQQLFKLQSKEASCTFFICFSEILKNEIKNLEKRA